MTEIQIVNRSTNSIDKEKVYGEAFMSWAYDSLAGQAIMKMVPLKVVSQFFGRLQDTKFSAKKIEKFVSDFNINMNDFLEEEGGGYSSFNSFFERKLAHGSRQFVQGELMAAFSEARYFGYENLDADERVPVKGYNLSINELLQNDDFAEKFRGGPVLIARLAPVDYHRFHFPDSGRIVCRYRLKGDYESVNPMALNFKNDILIKNEREVTILDTDNFGMIAYVEVGAVCVGKIVQTHSKDDFNRGDEKGTFLFGGSTVIVVGMPGKWRPSEDILKNSGEGLETYIQLGDKVGTLV